MHTSWKGFSGDERPISQWEELLSGNARDVTVSFAAKESSPLVAPCVGRTFASEAVLGLLNDVRLERCPEELAERTIRLLRAAAAANASGRTRRGHLF